MYMPPLTWIVWPVIYFALSDAKNATVFMLVFYPLKWENKVVYG
jgi:hypothetical protein